jgi:hypothetical protein
MSERERASCVYCLHALLGLTTGPLACESEEAHEALGEEKITEFLAAREHDCPFFEDDQLPW